MPVTAAHPQLSLVFAAASHDFDVAVLALGGLLVLGALVSVLARRSFLSLAAIYVLAGFVLGEVGVLSFPADTGFIDDLATVALIVILFRDGLEVEGELLRAHWQAAVAPPGRWRMPVTARSSPLLTHLLVGLGWTESFCSGRCCRRPTRCCPRRVVTNPSVCRP